MRTLAFGHHKDRTPTHVYAEARATSFGGEPKSCLVEAKMQSETLTEPSREAAMAAFAASWRRE
jgi:hypothetical protein